MQKQNNDRRLKRKFFKRSLLITNLQYLITGTAALCLSGCMGIYEGGFECPPGRGVGCKSISDVNQMVNQGDLPEKALSDLPPSQPHCEQCGAHQDQQIDLKRREKPEIWYPTQVLEEA